jgi:hypothetical protein
VAELGEKEQHWFAASFHLKHLLALRPGDPKLAKRHALAQQNWIKEEQNRRRY